MNSSFEHVLKVFPVVMVYQPGPRPSAEGYRAATWNESNFLTKGRLTISAAGDTAYVRIEDEHTDELFAECPVTVDNFSRALERVLDSSRYYVIRVVHEDKSAYLGMGFKERSESFDFMACLQDHIKHVKASKSSPKGTPNNLSKSDLSLKEGEQISISIPGKKSSKSPAGTPYEVMSFPITQTRSRSRSSGSAATSGELTQRKEASLFDDDPSGEWELF
ncbi:hypothetical protein P9112_012376 [Eukaryota sp. TZLM1-RC]